MSEEFSAGFAGLTDTAKVASIAPASKVTKNGTSVAALECLHAVWDAAAAAASSRKQQAATSCSKQQQQAAASSSSIFFESTESSSSW